MFSFSIKPTDAGASYYGVQWDLLFAPTDATAAIIPKLKAARWLPEIRKAKRRNRHPDIMPYRVDSHHILDVRLGETAL